VLRIVIVAGILLVVWPQSGALTVVVTGGLLVWSADEMARGVNPWRRCLGFAVAAYELSTLL